MFFILQLGFEKKTWIEKSPVKAQAPGKPYEKMDNEVIPPKNPIKIEDVGRKMQKNAQNNTKSTKPQQRSSIHTYLLYI